MTYRSMELFKINNRNSFVNSVFCLPELTYWKEVEGWKVWKLRILRDNEDKDLE
jgi:hypothetical protein